jgi:lipopolysaccharide export system protein LptA
MKLKPLVNRGVLLVCCLISGLTAGLSSDPDQPIEVEADSAELDDKERIAVYQGNVVVIQGSIRLTGDVLTLTYTPEHDIKEIVLVGKPARFRQRPDHTSMDTEGEALKIAYSAEKNLLSLIEKAKVNQQRQIYTGHRMDYDTKRSVLTLQSSGKTPPSGKPSAAERVKIIIPPKEKKKQE